MLKYCWRPWVRGKRGGEPAFTGYALFSGRSSRVPAESIVGEKRCVGRIRCLLTICGIVAAGFAGNPFISSDSPWVVSDLKLALAEQEAQGGYPVVPGKLLMNDW